MGMRPYDDDADNYEDDLDGEEAVEDFTCPISISTFYSDIKYLAKMYIERFFKDKMLYCGGKIPRNWLFEERRVLMVLNYDIVKGVDRAYKYLEDTLERDEVERAKITGEATYDIKLVNDTLNLLARSGIPQQFAGGMMCMYIEFVEGVDIGTEP